MRLVYWLLGALEALRAVRRQSGGIFAGQDLLERIELRQCFWRVVRGQQRQVDLVGDHRRDELRRLRRDLEGDEARVARGRRRACGHRGGGGLARLRRRALVDEQDLRRLVQVARRV